MIKFHSLHMQRHIVFADLTWQLDQQPLTVIRGEDRDAKIAVSNRVGKSLLPSTLTTILTDAPPVAIKKKSAKDMVKNKARLALHLHNDTDEYQIEQFAAGQSVKYDIKLNGQPQEIKKISDARLLIQRAVPLSEDHIFSQLYVNSYRPSILLYGSASARLNYFEQIFDLRIYDQLRRAVLHQLQQVNQDFLQNKLLAKQKHELTPALRKNVAKQLQRVQRQHQAILTEYTRAHESAQQLTAYVAMAEQLHSEQTVQQLHRQAKQLRKEIKTYSRLLELLRKHSAAAALAQQHAQQRLRLQKSLHKLQYRKIGGQLAKTQHRLQKLEQHWRDYHKYETHIDRYRQLSRRYQDRQAADPTSLQDRLTRLNFKLKQKRQLQNKKHCPLCGQMVPKSHQHNVQQLTQKISRTKKLIEHAKLVQYIQKVQAKIPRRLLQLDKQQCHRRLRKLRLRLNELQIQADININYQQLKQQLRTIPKPPRRTQQQDFQRRITNYTKKLERSRQARYRVINDLKLLEKLGNLPLQPGSLKAARKTLLREQSIVAQMTPQLQDISGKLQKLAKIDADYVSAARQLGKLEKQMQQLQDNLADRDILEALAKAYSTKGIRLLQVQALADAYINMLNRWSSFIYAHPIKFMSQVGPGQFDIIAERGSLSDVRMLSGAESRQFLALSALALISLMPAHLRCNLLVLDELEAGLSAINRRKLALDFIPLIQQYVDNLVVITPHSPQDFYIPDAKEKLLVRERGTTTWKT